jgi:arylsulfatase A-like enzyme
MRIIYLDIDCLRPDHLGCYGYHRQTSPAIDAIARDGLICENVYASDAPCLPSRTAFYSGRFGIQTGVVGHGGTAAQPKVQGPGRNFRDTFDEEGLARQLQLLNYHTAMISPFGQRHAAWHFYAGFNEIHNTGQGGMESAEVVQPVVDKWLADHGAQDNWFLHINYWDPHTPYRVPKAYGEPFADEPLPPWLDDDALIRRHNTMAGPHTSLDVMMYDDKVPPQYPRQPGRVADRAGMRKIIDGYDTGIRYVDDQVAKIVAFLKSAGIYEETCIIISADHGENFGELGIYAEHATADEGTCHIPLIVKFPGGVKGRRDPALHYNLDLAPTLIDLLGGPAKPSWDGRSYATTIKTGAAAGHEDLVISQCAHVCQRSVRWGNWLYLRTYHDGFHLFPAEMLYDLANDPHEQDDLAPKRPEIVREGAWRLARWHDRQMQKMAVTASDPVDPLWRVMSEGGPFHARLGPGGRTGQPFGGSAAFEIYLQRLEKTGRKAGAAALREKYAAWLSK